MALPKAVQQQAELAEQFDQQIAAAQAQAPAESAAAPAETPAAAATEVQTPSAPTQPAVEVKPDAQSKGDDGVWERRYRSLQGKYDSEVPSLHSQLRAQAEQLQSMAQRLQAMETAKPTEPETPLVSKDDETAFGADLIDLIRRVSTAQFQQLAATVTGKLEEKLKEIDTRVGNVSQVQAKSEEQKFWDAIDKGVPDWREINENQDFLTWLSAVDPLVGARYQDILVNAQQNLNAKQVIAVFEAWKKHAGVTPAAATQPTQADQTRQELESLAAPTSSRSTQPAAQPKTDSRIWTGAEYAQAYDPRLAKSKSVAEVEALRKAADLAVTENRVRW